MTIPYPQYELVIKTKKIFYIKNFHIITTVVCQCHIHTIYASCRIQAIEYDFIII